MGIWFLGKQVANRKAKKRARHYSDAAHAAWLGVTICGRTAPGALGLVEQPKRLESVPGVSRWGRRWLGAMVAARNRTA